MDIQEEIGAEVPKNTETELQADIGAEIQAKTGAQGRGSHSLLRCLLFLLLLPLSSLSALQVLYMDLPAAACCVLFLLVLCGLYVLLRRVLVPAVSWMNGILAALLLLFFTGMMILEQGNVESALMNDAIRIPRLFLCPGIALRLLLPNSNGLVLLFMLLGPILAFLLSVFLQRRAGIFRKIWPALAAGAACIAAMALLYANRPSVRYGGHGFEYMHGYSSTDFSDYMVYSEPSKLVELDHPAELIIEGEANMPHLDGAEACYPVYAAVAKAIYKDIAAIEKRYAETEGEWTWRNGQVVRFTNTVHAFDWLIYPQNGYDPTGERRPDALYGVDIFFGAKPSRSQMQEAATVGVDLTITPIGREAFVFFVEPDNPVTNLSSEQLRAIYHGDITNWSQLGGRNQEIRAFQRPAGSGSQAMMEYFMGDISLKEPQTYEVVGSMGGVVHEVAQYANEAGALGYSFRYFVEDLNQENNVRVLAVDGVLPTRENIENGSYPLTVPLVAVSRTGDPNPNVQKVIDFLLSPDGQEIIRRTGYGGVQ